jgi:hypothetical protein
MKEAWRRYVSLRITDRLYDRISRAATTDRRLMNAYLVILIEKALDEQDHGRGVAA